MLLEFYIFYFYPVFLLTVPDPKAFPHGLTPLIDHGKGHYQSVLTSYFMIRVLVHYQLIHWAFCLVSTVKQAIRHVQVVRKCSKIHATSAVTLKGLFVLAVHSVMKMLMQTRMPVG